MRNCVVIRVLRTLTCRSTRWFPHPHASCIFSLGEPHGRCSCRGPRLHQRFDSRRTLLKYEPRQFKSTHSALPSVSRAHVCKGLPPVGLTPLVRKKPHDPYDELPLPLREAVAALQDETAGAILRDAIRLLIKEHRFLFAVQKTTRAKRRRHPPGPIPDSSVSQVSASSYPLDLLGDVARAKSGYLRVLV
jgi:hypothetical protein